MRKTAKLILSLIFILTIIISTACSGKKNTPVPSTTAAQTEIKESTDKEEPQAASKVSSNASGSSETTAAGQAEIRYYSMDDVDSLENTDYFLKSAIKHIFNGNVNSSGKASGYHYDMIEESDGEIIDGTRSAEDENGLYTANITVNGKKKSHYSTFFPDSWSPQQVVDAINEAYEDAVKNNRKQGTTWIGYFGDIEIDMYLTDDEKIISAFPIYESDRH